MTSIHVGDVGTVLKMRLLNDETSDPIDLTLATLITLTLENPLGVSDIKPAVLSTDGSDGYMQYVVVEGDLDIAGTWNIQGYAEAGTYKNSSNVFDFYVNRNLT